MDLDLHPRTTAIILTITALVVGFVFLLIEDSKHEAYTESECPAGYAVVGEGCMTLKEACEVGGDHYYYNEAQQECLPKS